MATDQYHEDDLNEGQKDFARVITSMIEEAEAISWYQQRIASSKDEEVKSIIKHAQEEEFEHFAMELEWVTRKLPKFREVLKEILFKEGNIVEVAKVAEE